MSTDLDRYESWYSDRLWGLMPAVHRAADSVVFEERGPLRELIERIGAQMAIVRRSIDQLWDDQSIETCDDWVVPYLADLVAATLFSGLDNRGQRLQVAKAIYYRRRAGTVGILEEAAHDITGWEARVAEFFRNLGRTRHQLDMPIGLRPYHNDPALDLQSAERLVGPLTRTPAGGWADLRNAYGASRAHSAFDDLAHTADMRRGAGRTGWYNIPHLGIFVWRLHALPEVGRVDELLSDPVADLAMPNCFTFDPTGREVPLFAAASRTSDSYGSRWISPAQWQLPGPIDRELFDAERGRLYDPSSSLGVFRTDATHLVPFTVPDPLLPGKTKVNLVVFPERGRFWSLDPTNLRVLYHYGSPGRIGAGAYDRTLVSRQLAPAPGTDVPANNGVLPAIPATATLTIQDSRTYTPANVTIDNVTLRAKSGTRPLIRATPPAAWTITGNAGATLHLEGIFLSGADLVLAGDFAEVTIAFSSLDPGSAGDPAAADPFRHSINGKPLRPSTIFIEGRVTVLRIASSIAGPIRARGKGHLEHLIVDRSIVQSIPTLRFDGTLKAAEVFDLAGFVDRLRNPFDVVAKTLAASLSQATRDKIKNESGMPSPALQAALFADLNAQLPQLAITAFGMSTDSEPVGPKRANANQRLLLRWFPAAFDDLALALETGDVVITRSTILGRIAVHHIDVSESILHDVAQVEDPQHGCVRFSSWSTGSVLPRKYESVEVRPRAGIFTSTNFGQPGYGQLRRDADRVIPPPPDDSLEPPKSIREGAENGSEMGAFYDEINAIRERSLLLELQELMPVGLIPVIVPVT